MRVLFNHGAHGTTFLCVRAMLGVSMRVLGLNFLWLLVLLVEQKKKKKRMTQFLGTQESIFQVRNGEVQLFSSKKKLVVEGGEIRTRDPKPMSGRRRHKLRH